MLAAGLPDRAEQRGNRLNPGEGRGLARHGSSPGRRALTLHEASALFFGLTADVPMARLTYGQVGVHGD